MEVPGITGHGTGALTATAPPNGSLEIRFHDSDGTFLGMESVPAGETRIFAPRGKYMNVDGHGSRHGSSWSRPCCP